MGGQWPPIFTEALTKPDFVVILRYLQKIFRTYHLCAAPIFFLRTLPHLELELI